jgi:hypothetical protein
MTATAPGQQKSGDPGHLRMLRRSVWASLPALLVSSCVVCAGGIVVAALQPGITPLSLLAWAIVVGPLFGGLVAQAADVVLDFEVRAFGYFRYFRLAAFPGGAAALAPALPGALFVVGLSWWEASADPVALVLLAAAGPVCALALIASLVALPVWLRRPGLRGWPLAFHALGCAARRPVPAIGALAVVVIAVAAAVQFSASLLLLLPAPLALAVVVASWTTAAIPREDSNA